MKKIFYTIFFIIAFVGNSYAQKNSDDEKTKEQIAILTPVLKLSENQIQQLKPIFNEYYGFKKLKKKEKNTRKKEDKKLTDSEKSALKKAKEHNKDVLIAGLKKILSTDQYKAYTKHKEEEKRRKKID